MKKTTFFAVLLAGACLFTACDKEGVYNPKEKISAIYASYEYSYSSGGSSYTNSVPKHLVEKWNWDGKTLTSIENYDCEYNQLTGNVSTELDYVLDFAYDGKKLSRITMRGNTTDYVEFVYDGNTLTTINEYISNKVETSMTITHDGKKISKITVTSDEYDGRKDQKKIDIMDKLVMRSVLNDINAAEKAQQMAKRSVKKGTKGQRSYTYLFTWDGDNISKMEMEGGNSYATFTYDKKKNPLYGFYGFLVDASEASAFGFDFGNENNITSLNSVIQEGSESYTNTENYTYTYDGKWPITRTSNDTYTDAEYSSSYSRTTHFEYAD